MPDFVSSSTDGIQRTTGLCPLIQRGRHTMNVSSKKILFHNLLTVRNVNANNNNNNNHLDTDAERANGLIPYQP
jgi:hypothetical protein